MSRGGSSNKFGCEGEARDAWWLVGSWGRVSILSWFPGKWMLGGGLQAGSFAGHAPENGQQDRAEGEAGLIDRPQPRCGSRGARMALQSYPGMKASGG